MKLGTAIAEIMKREGIEILCGYPVNNLIEHAANAGIRPIMVRQERIGIHMADAISRVTSGHKIGAFCMQHGPGAENAFGGVAQAFSESVPILVVPGGYPRHLATYYPNFNSALNMRNITKWAEPVTTARAATMAPSPTFTPGRRRASYPSHNRCRSPCRPCTAGLPCEASPLPSRCRRC